MSRKSNIPVAVILVSFFALYVFFSFSSWNEPIMGDQMYFVAAIKCLNDSATNTFFTFVFHGAFWTAHPPGYILLARAITGIAQIITPLTMRFAGILLFCVSLVLMYLLMMRLLKDLAGARSIALFSCFLYAVNPLVIRGSLLIDIDGTVLNAALLLLMNVLARIPLCASLGHYVLAGVSCALALWCKLPGPLIFFASTIAYFLLQRDFKKTGRIIFIAAIGGTIFFVTWIAYCRVHLVSPDSITNFPIDIVSQFIKGGVAPPQRILYLLRNIWAPSVWAWPSFVILAGLSLVRIFKEKQAPGGGNFFASTWFLWVMRCVYVCVVRRGNALFPQISLRDDAYICHDGSLLFDTRDCL